MTIHHICRFFGDSKIGTWNLGPHVKRPAFSAPCRSGIPTHGAPYAAPYRRFRRGTKRKQAQQSTLK